MTCTNGNDRNDYCNNYWTSSNDERSSLELLSDDSLNEIFDKVDSSNDLELNVVADERCKREKSLLGSNFELNCTSSIHSADSWTSAVTHERSVSKIHFQSKLDYGSEEIPDLVNDDSMDDAEISDDSNSEDELPDEADEEFIMEQLEKLIIRRNNKNNEARLRWLRFLREQKEAQEEEKQFRAYWERRHQEDKDLWRDKDFANAIYKMCRAGYKGKHGHFDVPEQTLQKMNAFYMQVTVGDYDGNNLTCAKKWKELTGKTKIDCQKEFIKLANQAITMYGWNPPDGWL